MSEKEMIRGLTAATAVDLSEKSLEDQGIDPTDDESLRPFIFDGNIRYGGYGERRSLYQRSAHFSGVEPRNIHLGVDIWTDAKTPIFAPWKGRFVGVNDNQGIGDYGPTMIIAHQIDDISIHALYGHLDRSSLSMWKTGDEVQAGELIAHIGPPSENGGWLPHLHFQMIVDLQGNSVDYPGVCRQSEWSTYHKNCPDPHAYLDIGVSSL